MTPNGQTPRAPRLRAALFCAAAILLGSGPAAADPGTPADRAALLDELIDTTLRREAFSPIKQDRLGLDFRRQAEAMRNEFRAADTDEELYRALVKLSATRRDPHLRVRPVFGGLVVDPTFREAPVRFTPDYAASGDRPVLFLSGYALELLEESDVTPEVGDLLVSVNGRPLADHLRRLDPYLRYSNDQARLTTCAKYVSVYSKAFDPSFSTHTTGFTLERRDGTRYTLTLQHQDPAELSWVAADRRTYPGFRKAFDNQSFALYRRTDDRRIVLLDWHGFKSDLHRDLSALMRYAEAEGLLSHDVILDATHSRGGSSSPSLIRRLVSRPFRVTHGNLRISDVTEPFTTRMRLRIGGEARLVRWLETDVAAAAQRGDAYSPTVPFKLDALPADSDGLLEPADTRFRGRLVCLLGPGRGSQLDQFAAMIIDNGLGHTIGMPTDGFSNTWEWSEDIHLPTADRPVVARFMWTIGQTIRPNGQVLEGNPAVPARVIPITRDNYPTYHDDLLLEAVRFLTDHQTQGTIAED